MSEPDFLPPWYRELHRRRRQVVVQLAGLAALAVALGGAAVSQRAQLRAAEQEHALVKSGLEQSRLDLQKLEALKQLRDQWRRQDRVLQSTGANVEASRLLAALIHVLPPDTTYSDVAFAVEEPEADDVRVAAPPATAPSRPDRPAVQPRRLKVTVRGVAPGELAVGQLLAGISRTPLFRHVNLSYAKDREEHDRQVREFEVTFVINLAPEPSE